MERLDEHLLYWFEIFLHYCCDKRCGEKQYTVNMAVKDSVIYFVNKEFYTSSVFTRLEAVRWVRI